MRVIKRLVIMHNGVVLTESCLSHDRGTVFDNVTRATRNAAKTRLTKMK